MPSHGSAFVSGSLDSVVLVLAGVALVFAGVDAARIVAGFVLGVVLAIMFYVAGLGFGVAAALLLGLLGFIIGFAMGFVVLRVAVSLVGGFLLADILVGLLPARHLSGLAILVLGIVLAAVLYVVAEYVIAAAVVATGSIITYAGLTYWFPTSIAALAALALFVAGLAHNWSRIRARKD